jgi:uncharacterized protein YbjQ (UPF0145 family)
MASADDDLARIEAGGIPLGAEQRLKALAGEGSLFTSGLSVNEYALLAQAGPEPLAQVMGASVVQPGWQYLPALPPGQVVRSTSPWGPAGSWQWRSPYTEPSPRQVASYKWYSPVVCELETIGDAWNLARRRALDRLAEEALQVRADAVVGVRIHRSDHDRGRGTIEFAVLGTAVRVPGSDGAAWPVLTDVSVQDYVRLRRAGQEPAGFLATTVVTFASAPTATRLRRARTTRAGQELEELTQAFHAARDTARARLVGQLRDAHGTGAIGVTFSHSVHRDKLALASSLSSSQQRGWHTGRLGIPYFVSGHSDTERSGWAITMHASGTAIRPGPAGEPQTVKAIMRVGSG